MFPQKVAQWFSMRGISEEILNRFGVRWNGTEIVIPIRDEQGNTLFNKYRRDPFVSTGPKYRNETNSNLTLFNYNSKAKRLILTEGEMDCMLLSSLGYETVSSTGGSSTFKKEWIELLRGKEIYICYDTDEAGIRGAVKIAWLLFNNIPVKLIQFPIYFSGKDVTEYMEHHTKKDFDRLMEHAIELPYFGDGEIGQIKEAIDACVQQRKKLKELDLSQDILEEHLKLLNNLNTNIVRKKKKKKQLENIDNVKHVPIDRFIEFNAAGFAKCLWHNEKTPSMRYYPKTNSIFCFGCKESGDVITVIQKLNNCSFLEAIEILKKEI